MLVDDQVQVYVADVPGLRETRCQTVQSRREKRLGTVVGSQGAHLARHLPHLAGEEALVLEVDAGWAEKAAAIEIGANAYLDPFQPLHQQHALISGSAEHEGKIRALGVVADEGGAGGVIVLQHVAPGVLTEPFEGKRGMREGMAFGDGEPSLPQDGLAELAILLQPVAVGAAADYTEALGPQGVLQLATTDPLEEDDAVLPDPVQLCLPVRDEINQATEGPLLWRVLCEDPDLVPLPAERQVDIAEIGAWADGEDPHVCFISDLGAAWLAILTGEITIQTPKQLRESDVGSKARVASTRSASELGQNLLRSTAGAERTSAGRVPAGGVSRRRTDAGSYHEGLRQGWVAGTLTLTLGHDDHRRQRWPCASCCKSALTPACGKWD